MPHWLFHVMGLDDPAGAWYLFWSGVFQAFLVLGSAIAWIRHMNCHTPWCPRLGRYVVPGTPFKHCKKHHPDFP